jgi:hypothetical protein
LHTDTNLNKNVARPFNTEEGRNMHNWNKILQPEGCMEYGSQ